MRESMPGRSEAPRHFGGDGGPGRTDRGGITSDGNSLQALRERLAALEAKLAELQSEAEMRLDEVKALRFYSQKLEVALKRQSANVAGLCDFRDGIMREIIEVADPTRFKLMDREHRLRRFDEAFSRFMQTDQLVYQSANSGES
jgi:hypothetical protein